jgi:site-specific recombinase XerD
MSRSCWVIGISGPPKSIPEYTQSTSRKPIPGRIQAMRIRELIPGYLEELKILNRSPLTIRNIRGALNAMVLFLEDEGITELVQFNRDALHLFQEDLAYRLTAKGKQLSVSTREKYLCSVRGFARYLYATDYLTADLSKTITLPKQPKRLPKVILEHAEITKIMAAPDMRTSCRLPQQDHPGNPLRYRHTSGGDGGGQDR